MNNPFHKKVTCGPVAETGNAKAPAPPRSIPLHTRIVIGLAIGAGAGGGLKAILGVDSATLVWMVRHVADPVGQLFLRLLLMIVVPLVFSSLVIGVAGIGDLRRLGRVGLKSFAYTLAISAISVAIGLTLANTIRPGSRMEAGKRGAIMARYSSEAWKSERDDSEKSKSADAPLMMVVKTIVPTNPLESAARSTPDMLGVMFFALVFGLALTLVERETAAPVVALFTSVYEAVGKIIGLIMRFAPIAVACLLFSIAAQFGFGFLVGLGWFVLTVLLGLAIHMFVVYSLSVKFLSRISPLEFFRRVKVVMVTAFSTSSSNATLPTALRVSEENLGVPRAINSFVLTVGATANQNGTALYEGVTILFLAQLAGVDLSFGKQLMVVYLAILGGVGTAGVPSGSIPFIVMVLATVGLDPGLIAVVLGVDRILDMCRTVLNVVGDITAATYVAVSEGTKLLPAAN
ncbi:MAG: dicarboxylate/amino acid:cation symporter [Acidobacteria bacterium]|nr:dicarboxylate/amino acid:cation symporter [Acidobacteriota bacterium]